MAYNYSWSSFAISLFTYGLITIPLAISYYSVENHRQETIALAVHRDIYSVTGGPR